MGKLGKLLAALLLWCCIVLFITFIYTHDTNLRHDTAQVKTNAATTTTSTKSGDEDRSQDFANVMELLSLLSEEDIEQLKDVGLNLRGLDCALVEDELRCRDTISNVLCPPHVDFLFLSAAESQHLCQPDAGELSYCTVSCASDGSISWRAHSKDWCESNAESPGCKGNGVCCPPVPWVISYQNILKMRKHVKIFPPSTKISTKPKPKPKPEPETQSQPEPKPQAKPPAPITKPQAPADEFLQPFNGQKDLSESDLRILKTNGFNLRGLLCEHDNGKVVCFRRDNQAREKCPDWVTPAYLSLASTQYACMPVNKNQYYCTAQCQEGSEEVKWSAHEISWCAKNPTECPPRNYYVPIDEYETPKLTNLQKGEIFGKCTGGDGITDPDFSTVPPDVAQQLKQISVGALAKGELISLRDAMATWAKGGLLQAVGEFTVFLNERNKEMEEMLEPYTKDPYNIKIMGDSKNHGITWAINWLAGNASTPYFLFLEKDFQMIESFGCMAEQLSHGVRLLTSDIAHVVKFRSRRHPGFPNWVDNYYRGHEDDCLTSRQPNLFCNVFHWIEEPNVRWPKHFWDCDAPPTEEQVSIAGKDRKKPIFYCSDAYFCNWTNNPVLFKPEWWRKEYVEGSFRIKRSGNDPYNQLEGYMNWEPHAWNDRKWVIAQGEGLFTHRDRNNFGL